MILSIKTAPALIDAELNKTKNGDETIVDFFSKNIDIFEDVVLFGWAIRDIFLFGEINPDSDLDFVVRCDKERLKKMLASFNPVENKFGGFRFLFGQRQIDVWPLEETWAIKNGYSRKFGSVAAGRPSASMMDLLNTTLFNVDSVYYRVNKGNLICSTFFLNGIRNNILKLNLEKNPSPQGVIKRIGKMRDEKGFEVDSGISNYINNLKIKN